MKRNFFKKLSFVLASAMVLTTLAPASGALAAGGPKLNSTKKYLHLGRVEEGTNEFNFNIKNKGKGWKYEWTSANQDVAKVNAKNGVTTATGVGSTKVTVVISDKDGEELEKLTAKVTVRDNIEVVKISNLPTEAIAVGEEYDFNRSYVTESGSSKKTSGITRWEVSPATATINDKGVFVASEAGEYTITANSFQSKAKYTEWLASKDSDLVTATVSEKVTVENSMVKATQNNLSKVNVLFSSPVTKEEAEEKLYVNKMIGEVPIKEQDIKEIKMSDDGLTAVVEIYDTFEPKASYQVTYANMDPVFFTAATTDPKDVTSINITTTKATLYKDTEVEVELKNADGVILNQPVDPSNLEDRVTLESSNDLVSLVGKSLLIFNKGDSTTVTATYHTYTYKDNGEENVIKDVQVIVGVEESDVIAKGIASWTIVSGSSKPKFDDTKQFVAVKDSGRRLFVKVNLSKDDDTDNSYVSPLMFKYNSSDTSILFVDDSGYLVPVKTGSVRVTVEYNEKYVGYINITVNAERKAARLSIDKGHNVVSNAFADVAEVEVKLLDQYGDDYAADGYSANFVLEGLSSLAKTNSIFAVGNDISFDPSAPTKLAKGTYRYKVYDAAFENITGQVVFNVQEPDTAAQSWRLVITGDDYDNGNLDLVVNDEADQNKKFNVQLMGYAKNGVKTGPEALAGYAVTAKDAKGKVVTPGAIVAGNTQSFDATWAETTVSGTAIRKLDTGRYTVEAKQGNVVKARAVFVIKDSQELPKLSVLGFRTSETSGIEAFVDCFEVKLGDDVVAKTHLTPKFERTNVADKAYVKSVVVREYVAVDADADPVVTSLTHYIEHEVDVKFYVTVPVDFDSYIN